MALGEPERELIVEHFLRGRSQAELAREKGVSKATVCRRMEAALGALRRRIGCAPAVGTATVLAAWAQNAQAQVPASLTAQLGKMSMVSGSGFGTSAGAGVGAVSYTHLTLQTIYSV